MLWANYLQRLLPELKQRQWKILLETNGTLPEAFEKISEYIDVLDMDIKLTGSEHHDRIWQAHDQFLTRIPDALCAYVKLVVNHTIKQENLEIAASYLRHVHLSRCVFIQPEAALWKEMAKGSEMVSLLMFCQQTLAKALPGLDIRILPQLHQVLKIL